MYYIRHVASAKHAAKIHQLLHITLQVCMYPTPRNQLHVLLDVNFIQCKIILILCAQPYNYVYMYAMY